MTYIPDVWSDRRVQGGIGGALLAGVGAGMAIGFILAKRKFKNKHTTVNVFEAIKSHDVNPYSIGFKKEKLQVEETENGIGYSLVIPNDPEESVVIVPSDSVSMEDAEEAELVGVTTLLNDDPDWDYETEIADRVREQPYIIHVDEFKENEFDFNQETLTFYAGDGILAQEPTDEPIYGYLNLMGELKFGHGSKDPNVVYIRNEAIRMEWEILRHHGHYRVEVEGHTMEQEVDDEIQHSYRRVMKFRGD